MVILAEKNFQIMFKQIFIIIELVLKLEGTLQVKMFASFYIKFMLPEFLFRLCHLIIAWLWKGHIGCVGLIFKVWIIWRVFFKLRHTLILLIQIKFVPKNTFELFFARANHLMFTIGFNSHKSLWNNARVGKYFSLSRS